MILTVELLSAACGSTPAVSAAALPGLQTACDKYAINTPLRAAAFLANVGVESAQLTATVENLNYRADRLLAVFPSHFTQAEAQQYAGKPEAIANRAYASRMGNGDEASGDGWKYRGRGYIQLTGRFNYSQAAAGLGLDLLNHPELLETPAGAATSAAYFWNKNALNRFADLNQCDRVCKAINLGNAMSKNIPAGYTTRLARYNAALKVLGVSV
jgi:putative chitinase